MGESVTQSAISYTETRFHQVAPFVHVAKCHVAAQSDSNDIRNLDQRLHSKMADLDPSVVWRLTAVVATFVSRRDRRVLHRRPECCAVDDRGMRLLGSAFNRPTDYRRRQFKETT